MCGRFAQGDIDAIYSKYRIKVTDDLRKVIKPRYNIAPTNKVPVVVEKEKKFTLEIMKWGLVPFWAKDEKIGYKMINARSETVAEKPSYRKPFKSQRCIVPATGFYEWQNAKDKKIPYYFKPKGEKLFAIAGLFDIWKDPDGKDLKTFTILTTEPNKMAGSIHDRMPLILEENEEKDWLDPANSDTDFLQALFDPYPADRIEFYKVSQIVNSPKNDSKEIIKPQNG